MRRSWRLLAAGALLLSAGAFLFSASLYNDIQDSRKDVCLEGNARHDATLAKLDELIQEIPPDSPRRLRAERDREQTVALIEALAPRRDCENLVRPGG